MSVSLNFYASCAPGAEKLLAEELNSIGISARAEHAGAGFSGTLESAYRVCLWSRIASRVLLQIEKFPAADAEELYRGVREVDWNEHLGAQGSFKASAVLVGSKLTHSLFVVQRIKDAIVDQFRERSAMRPSVDRDNPDLRVHAYIFRDVARLSIDLSGAGLHRRGYRGPTTAAPLKENLAAAILYFAGWPAIAEAGGGFLDPLCGSGVLLIEAALMAFDIAPGILRQKHGFLSWRGHDALAWKQLLEEAEARRQAAAGKQLFIAGSDIDPNAVSAADANIQSAGLSGRVRVDCRPLSEISRISLPPVGLLVSNPPWGERIGAEEGIGALYAELGRALRSSLAPWHAAILTTAQWSHRLRVKPDASLDIENGPISLKLLGFSPRAPDKPIGALPEQKVSDLRPAHTALADRLKKNLKRLARWRKDEGITCFRLYDADIPEYGLAVDVYQSRDTHALVHEYSPPSSVPEDKAARRLREAIGVVAEVLAVPLSRVILKERRRQGSEGQYEKLDGRREFLEVEESGIKLLVNLKDYLDSGLYLDHRKTRAWLRAKAGGKRVLNLYGYTGAATVQVAAGGAAASVTIDRSNTYLDWAQRNFELNRLSLDVHQLVRADCLAWLRDEERLEEPRYDLIFADPPTFSNSKSLERDFDVQRDHVALIHTAMRLLEPGGSLLFSVHFRRFKLDPSIQSRYRTEDMNAALLPPDFARSPRIHYCWRITQLD